MRPLHDYIVVKRTATDDRSPGGLYLPPDSKDKPQTGDVVAVGPGTWVGPTWVTPSVCVGDTVLIGKYTGSEVVIEDEAFLVVKYSDLLCVVGGDQ